MERQPNMSNHTPANDDIENTLYAKRQKIYPREVHGIFARFKFISVISLLGLFYIIPWLQWGERQIILFDLPARKFYIFGMVFWPQDFFYLSALLMIAAFSLFFFTTLAGRLWCGYACPQTVWTEVFLWIERWVEGDRPQQMKLDKSAWDGRKIRLKMTKQFLWLSFSLFTGFTFVGYFTPIRELSVGLMNLDLGGWEWFWFLFYGFATYGNAGYLREQICIYMCPYARFQSAMFDMNTLVIAYDAKRGEPRGQRKKNTDYKAHNLGECINCTLCIQVCPTGIDIRNGLQEQCIGCAACVDVCDDVMDKMGYPKGLVRYTTENALEGKPTQILRPRVFVYAGLLLVLLSATIYGIATRIPLELDIMRDRNVLYKETNEGMILNVYNLRIVNMDDTPHVYNVKAEGIEGLELHEIGELRVDAGSIKDVSMHLLAAPAHIKQRATPIKVEISVVDRPKIRSVEKTTFLGPR
jgi:cytochrome c oxidase accessory protein FixG